MSLRIESFEIGPFPNNLYLLIDEAAREVVVIDPSIQSDEPLARVRELEKDGLALSAIWNTHGHLDHIYDNAQWKELFDVPVLMHEADTFFLENLREQAIWLGLPPTQPVAPDRFLQAGETLAIGSHAARVLHTPGHSPGSVAFYFADDDLIFSGDVLFQGSVGRTDLPGCDGSELQNSLRTVAALPPQTRVLSGHGAPTTVAAELASNPFLTFLRDS